MAALNIALGILKSALLEDWWLKITCLLLASLMWLYIDSELSDQGTFIAAPRAADIQLPDGWELDPNQPLPQFIVQLRGPRRRVATLSAESIVFQPQPIKDPQPGRTRLTMDTSDVAVEGFDVLRISPKDDKGAFVYLVPTARRTKRVRVKTIGRPQAKFAADPPVSDPDQINIEGPADILDKVDCVWTEDVELSGADQDVEREVAVLPYAEINGKRLSFRTNNAVVRVSVHIHPERVTRRLKLDVRPLAISGTSLSIEPKSVEVEVQAEEQEFAAPEFSSRVLLFAEWPAAWSAPKDSSQVLGPIAVQVRAVPPAHVEVRGVNGEPLPTVNVRGALCGTLTKEK